MTVINLLGVPGSGKSTAAAYIFYRLKEAGINCELVTEVAKDMVWDDNMIALKNQLYIAGSQSYRLSRLDSKVDVVVTDAPLMLQAVYYRYNNCPEPSMFEVILNRISEQYKNINLLLPIPPKIEKIGRIHGETESENIFDSIVHMLDKYDIKYEMVRRDSKSLDEYFCDDFIRSFKEICYENTSY